MRLPYALALCTSVSVTTVENTKAMMEYMKEVLLDELHVRENPWALKYVRLGLCVLYCVYCVLCIVCEMDQYCVYCVVCIVLCLREGEEVT